MYLHAAVIKEEKEDQRKCCLVKPDAQVLHNTFVHLYRPETRAPPRGQI